MTTLRGHVRKSMRRALEVTGLVAHVQRRAERKLTRQTTPPYEDGLPMPPPALRVVVSGTPDASWFSKRGEADAERILQLATAHGLDSGAPLRVWDLGCGCGRVARHIAPQITAAGGLFQGSDIDPRGVRWCDESLPGEYFTNKLRPPTRQQSASIDLVYAVSVLTHLRENATETWIEELARVVRPGGLAVLTFHDEAYATHHAPPQVQGALSTTPYIVVNDALEGSNYMSSWMTAQRFSALSERVFKVREIIPGAKFAQAIGVLERRT
jgi:ubiquinone/menaquinone biosynthesis C-methylase UbiE